MPIPASQLPAAAKAFVQQNFPGRTIVYAEKDTEFMKTKYEVLIFSYRTYNNIVRV